MIAAFALILGFQLGGEILSRLLDLPLPGPVLGMVGLLLAFVIRPGLARHMQAVLRPLLMHMSLFFVPAGVGVITHEALLGNYGAAILIVLLVSTVLALAAGALAFVLVAKWQGARRGG